MGVRSMSDILSDYTPGSFTITLNNDKLNPSKQFK